MLLHNDAIFIEREPYSGKLSRDCEFRGFVAIHEVFSTKFGDVASFGATQASNPWKFYLQKLYFLSICESFLPRKFSAIQYFFLQSPFEWLYWLTSFLQEELWCLKEHAG